MAWYHRDGREMPVCQLSVTGWQEAAQQMGDGVSIERDSHVALYLTEEGTHTCAPTEVR